VQRGEAAYVPGPLATADGTEKKNLKRGRETGRLILIFKSKQVK